MNVVLMNWPLGKVRNACSLVKIVALECISGREPNSSPKMVFFNESNVWFNDSFSFSGGLAGIWGYAKSNLVSIKKIKRVTTHTAQHTSHQMWLCLDNRNFSSAIKSECDKCDTKYSSGFSHYFLIKCSWQFNDDTYRALKDYQTHILLFCISYCDSKLTFIVINHQYYYFL